MLPPSNTVSVKKGDTAVKHNSWWDYDFSEPDNSMSFEDAKDETKRLLQKAVDQQVVADVPVGSYLSGGMDSPIPVILRRCRPSRLFPSIFQ